ncbi:HtaA domain-containing protein [Paraoerskovia sediminicola]|uniref:HtaA domain-containing protein n=1 Tax=Paraoerskovia sediminicola TaxID=1138587 RepID=UPI003D9B7039
MGAGTVSASDGAAAVTGGAFRFPQADADLSSSRTGSADYRGTVRFSAHHGQLDLRLSNPRVEISSSTRATLVVDVRSTSLDGTTTNDTSVDFASLALGSAKVTATNGAVTWAGAPATLTSAGAEAFSGFYEAGDALDPVTFTVGADAANDGSGSASGSAGGSTGGSSTDSGGSSDDDLSAATLSSSQVSPGDDVTISGAGFGASERGIVAEVRSTPQVLETGITADANGRAAATVTIPADLPAGEHTLLLIGADHTVSAPITVVASATSAGAGVGTADVPACTASSVSGATLAWGIKSSFRAYVTGPIAGGSVSTSGATSSGDAYRWAGGSGKFNTDRTQGYASWSGTVQFSGHDGLLDLKISNPRVRVTSASSANLVVDVASSDMSGVKSSASGVVFATLSLAGNGGVSGSTASWTNAPATLTAAGAAAFAGFYAAGDALDPVSFSLPLGGDVACDAGTGSLASTGSDLTAAWFALLLVLAGTGLVVVRRRSAARV